MTDETESTRDAKLDVLGREHQSLVAAGQQVHHTLIWEIVLSFVGLAFYFGWVAIGPQLSFDGMTISVSEPYLLLGLAVAVTVLFWRGASLSVYGHQLRRHISMLYDSLGYTTHTDRTGFTGFVYPDLLVVLGALPTKMFSYYQGIFQERPVKRGPIRTLISLSWLLTFVVILVLFALLYGLPLIMDTLFISYLQQHHMEGFTGVAIIILIVLGLVYIASLSMYAQATDRQELFPPAIFDLVTAMQENAQYVQDSKRKHGAGTASADTDIHSDQDSSPSPGS